MFELGLPFDEQLIEFLELLEAAHASICLGLELGLELAHLICRLAQLHARLVAVVTDRYVPSAKLVDLFAQHGTVFAFFDLSTYCLLFFGNARWLLITAASLFMSISE